MIAWPRDCGGVITAMAAPACGVNTAAPSSVTVRTMASTVKLGDSAASAWPTAYHSNHKREQPAAIAAGHHAASSAR